MSMYIQHRPEDCPAYRTNTQFVKTLGMTCWVCPASQRQWLSPTARGFSGAVQGGGPHTVLKGCCQCCSCPVVVRVVSLSVLECSAALGWGSWPFKFVAHSGGSGLVHVECTYCM